MSLRQIEIVVGQTGFLPHEAWLASTLLLQVEARPTGFPGAINSPWPARLNSRDLLLCAGIALSPATSPFDHRAWAFLIEHGASIEPRAGVLRVVDESEHWDPRIRTLFAERIGVGFAAWFLWRHFDVVHIADVAPFLSKSLTNPGHPYHGKQLKLTGLHGELRPDFLCLTPSLEGVLAESKGALGPPSAISPAEKKKAKAQLKNVSPVGLNMRSSANRLAFATNLRTASEETKNSASDTGVYIQDPDAGDRPVTFDTSPDAIVIDAYAKILSFLGLGTAAYLLRRGLRPLLPGLDEAAPPNDLEEVAGEPVVVLQDVFGHRFGLPSRVAAAVLNEPPEGVATRVAAALAESAAVQLFRQRQEPAGQVDLQQPGGLFLLPNGLIGIPD